MLNLSEDKIVEDTVTKCKFHFIVDDVFALIEQMMKP